MRMMSSAHAFSHRISWSSGIGELAEAFRPDKKKRIFFEPSVYSVRCLTCYSQIVMYIFYIWLFCRYHAVKTVDARLSFDLPNKPGGEAKQGTYKVLHKLKA